MREIPAGKFKDTCLKTLDEVAAGRGPVVITKWGRPVARLVPVIAHVAAKDTRYDDIAGSSARCEARATPAPYAAQVPATDASKLEAAASDTNSESAEERLRRLAAGFGVAPEALLTEALDAYLGDDDLARRIAAARKVGAYRSGYTNLARDHDAALEEIYMERFR